MKKQNNVSKLASSLLLTALLPSPSFGIPSPPAGLYDVMIESNCFNWPEQNNIRNGSWQVKRVSVWPGQTSIHMRTVSDTDTVSFSTSHPHLVQLPPTMQLPGPIGGILYTRKSSFISFNEPSQPTNIEVNVHSSHPANKSYTLELLQQAASTVLFAALTEGPSNVSLDPGSAWRNRGKDIKRLRLYPPLEFMGLVSPIKNKTIEVGTPVTYSADYSYANANNGLTRATFSRPRFQAGVSPTWHEAQGNGWPSSTRVIGREVGKKQISHTFTPKWPSNAVLDGLNVSSIKVELKVTPESGSCVTGLASDKIVFRLKNPNYKSSSNPQIMQRAGQSQNNTLQRAPSKIAPVKRPEKLRSDPR